MWYTNMADSNSCYASGHVGEKTLLSVTYLLGIDQYLEKKIFLIFLSVIWEERLLY